MNKNQGTEISITSPLRSGRDTQFIKRRTRNKGESLQLNWTSWNGGNSSLKERFLPPNKTWFTKPVTAWVIHVVGHLEQDLKHTVGLSWAPSMLLSHFLILSRCELQTCAKFPGWFDHQKGQGLPPCLPLTGGLGLSPPAPRAEVCLVGESERRNWGHSPAPGLFLEKLCRPRASSGSQHLPLSSLGWCAGNPVGGQLSARSPCSHLRGEAGVTCHCPATAPRKVTLQPSQKCFLLPRLLLNVHCPKQPPL